MIEYQKYNTPEWQRKKEAATDVAMKETNENGEKYIEECRKMEKLLNEDCDSEDWDNPYADIERCGNEMDMHQMDFIERFCKALQYNYVFDAGFFINGGNDICYCPCNRKLSSRWINDFQIDFQDGCSDICKNGYFNTPQELMDHLDSVGKNGFLHRSVATYLRFVHKEFFDKKKKSKKRKKLRQSHNKVQATETDYCELPHYQKEEQEILYHVHDREFKNIVGNNWTKRQTEVNAKKEKEEKAENKTAINFKGGSRSGSPVMKTATGVAVAESLAPSATEASAKPPPKATVMKTATGVAKAESIAPLSTAASNQHKVEKKNTTATGRQIMESPARSTAAAAAKSETQAPAMKKTSQDSNKVTEASNQQDVEKKDKHQVGQERMDANNEEQDKDTQNAVESSVKEHVAEIIKGSS